ncbi:type II toxin-antitoxin system PemK/MazF family toxin [Herbidospora sp. NEAU-GS84]|uniref:Type II toxin-antitoxin system PemK/MazF family toxin n=1 Tax=Herbidospora solisilvae TaxID=2696284 RepID=A0A7C9JD90_9ACTN|nr:type II toxin-antitoxin system PemK/MazF family toxin [Herbidospora solisilvae]NAS22123.1 type II toxin-antitoxin system PemK/MazF family toxin [Herbidospora solisilvae]
MTTNAAYPLRGRVYMADLGEDYGEKPYVIVSNNARNRALPSYLAVRVTTSAKPPLPSIVELTPEDPLAGRVLCDDIVILFEEDLQRDLGGLSLHTMLRVNQGLRHALAL